MTLHRRKFLGVSAAAAAAAAGARFDLGSIAAQDATPAPSPAPDMMTMYGPVQGNSAYKLAFMQVFPSKKNMNCWDC